MITTSTDFGTQMTAYERKTYGRIDWKQIDITSNNDATLTASSTESISNLNAVIDEDYTNVTRYATFETNRFKLDGSFIIPQNSVNTGSGWWSEGICNTSKVFTVPETIQFDFTLDHDSVGFTIVFDTALEEYATDFTITCYNAANALIKTITETNNTLLTYVVIDGVADYRKIILTINKWSVAERRARVQEFMFGVLQTYDATNKLIDFLMFSSF
jgi:hypothetical protein